MGGGIFQLYRGSQFIGGGNWSTRRKPPTIQSRRQPQQHQYRNQH